MAGASSLAGIVLFGHGSRDPLWCRPLEAVAQRLGAREPARLVRCAYLELQPPDLAAATADLVHQGVERIRVVPMFLGAGRHVRDDLPRLVEDLRARHPGLPIELQPVVGEDGRLLDLLADIAIGS